MVRITTAYKCHVYIGHFLKGSRNPILKGDLLISHGYKPITQIYSHRKRRGQKLASNIIQPSRPKIWRTVGGNSMISYFHLYLPGEDDSHFDRAYFSDGLKPQPPPPEAVFENCRFIRILFFWGGCSSHLY